MNGNLAKLCTWQERKIPATVGPEKQMYSLEQKNSCMSEFLAFLLPTNLGQPMHSPLALMEHVSLNFSGTFLLDPVQSIT